MRLPILAALALVALLGGCEGMKVSFDRHPPIGTGMHTGRVAGH